MIETPHFGRIGICGTGRVANALAVGLARYSAKPVMIWGRSPEHAAGLAHRTGGEAAPGLELMAGVCDMLVLAVADDAMEGIAAALGAVMDGGRAPFIFHVSGRCGLAPLEPIAREGAHVAAIHPAMTFTGDPAAELARMAGARFAVTTAHAKAAAMARDVVHALGGVAVEVAETQRALYHAALCHAANHLVTLIAGSVEALARAGVEEGAALLAPLVGAALGNTLERGMGALSGPLLRGDSRTVGGHVAALEAKCPELLHAYRAMAHATLDALERDGSPPSSAMRGALTPPGNSRDGKA